MTFSPVLVAFSCLALLSLHFDARADDPSKSPLAIKLTADKTTLKPDEVVTFTLTVTNRGDAPLMLDAKPAKHLNNGRNALLSGELFRRVSRGKDADELQAPELVSWGGKQPLLFVRDEVIPLAAGESKSFKSVAMLKRTHTDPFRNAEPADPTPRLVFDDYTSGVNRSAPAFRVEDGKRTFRVVYERKGIKTVSNDVVLELVLTPKKEDRK